MLGFSAEHLVRGYRLCRYATRETCHDTSLLAYARCAYGSFIYGAAIGFADTPRARRVTTRLYMDCFSLIFAVNIDMYGVLG